MVLFLVAVSGIAWTVVYLKSIQLGLKEKTYCIPLWALGLNMAWEIIYAFNGICSGDFGAQTIANISWMVCDALIVYTYFKYGRKWMPEQDQKYFIPYSVLAFVSCMVMQLAFYLNMPWLQAAQYSAFAQNVLMSVMFVVMLRRRGSTEGQSMVIAVAKWLGTLAPAIQQGIVEEFNIYIILCGVLCSVWDILYIAMLSRKKKEEAALKAG